MKWVQISECENFFLKKYDLVYKNEHTKKHYHITDGPQLVVIRLSFSTLWWYESNKHSVETILVVLNFDLFLDKQWSSMILSHDAGQQ